MSGLVVGRQTDGDKTVKYGVRTVESLPCLEVEPEVYHSKGYVILKERFLWSIRDPNHCSVQDRQVHLLYLVQV